MYFLSRPCGSAWGGFFSSDIWKSCNWQKTAQLFKDPFVELPFVGACTWYCNLGSYYGNHGKWIPVDPLVNQLPCNGQSSRKRTKIPLNIIDLCFKLQGPTDRWLTICTWPCTDNIAHSKTTILTNNDTLFHLRPMHGALSVLPPERTVQLSCLTWKKKFCTLPEH